MKFGVSFAILIFTLLSCSKDKTPKPITIADKFVGTWRVIENASLSSGGAWSTIFYSTVVKQNDSTFGLVESNRTPIPIWIYFANSHDYRTIYFIPHEQTNEMFSGNPLCAGKYSSNMDTLYFTYTANSPGIYDVWQIWVRE